MERLDPDQIYDPNNGNSAPKIKQVFRITKEHRYDEICRAMHRHKKSSPLMAPTSARKCLTEVGQPPAAAMLEPPVLAIDDEDDVNVDDEYMMESHKQEDGVGGKAISQLAGGQ